MDSGFACLLENRGVIGLGGPARQAFLQGLISNDTGPCMAGRAIYAALLTPQGKFLHDLFVIGDGEEFLIDCEAARGDDLLKRLEAYKLRAKITLRDARGEFGIWALSSNPPKHKPGSSPAANQSLPNNAPDHGPHRGGICFVDPRLPKLGLRAILKKGTAPADSPRMTFDIYDRHRLALGAADGSRDLLIEKSTLTEGNFDLLNGISFSKGCYVGQELTARMHYRALAKKRLFPVKITGAAPVFGAPVMLGGEEIGDMRSSNGDLGVALLNIEKAELAAQEKTLLTCGVNQLTVTKPEWMNKKD